MKILRIKMLEENSLQIKERMGWIFKLFFPLFFISHSCCVRAISRCDIHYTELCHEIITFWAQ